MALLLTLKPHERVIISGAALRNGATRTTISIENEVPVLREPDILSPSAVQTPCERVYMALQLLYVDPGKSREYGMAIQKLTAEVLEAAPSCRQLIEQIQSQAAAGKLYQALKTAKQLLHHERELMPHAE